ncbi:hypothetical protein FHS27_001399 [Rhodopirellula rubra]|uniref:EF-hand domain-containing protein n=1 Tax=Aporhodopirellula rubra TaxID=980271 RepID=A0A7W5DWA8_9BACT|nr:hypothetical protein [Aporhodopirellula rubra]MBB3205595.1 hypothetical protein [Aporhodopirellula rubra]
MKLSATFLAVSCALLFACQTQAQPPNRLGAGRDNDAKGQDRGGPGRGQARDGEQRRQRGGMADRDPAQMVGRLIEQFDKDGDEKLDSTELTALLTMMRDRRGGQMGGNGERPPFARNGDQAGPKARDMMQRKRRNAGNEDATPGGDLPKRPLAE